MSELDDREKRIENAAILISGNHSNTAYDMLYGALSEIDKHHYGAGARAYYSWIASLEMLASICLAIATLEKKKRKEL